MPDLSTRSYQPEIMDQPGISAKETRQALREIDFINQWLGGYNVVTSALEELPLPDRTLTIIDIGSGGGGMIRMLSRWAKRRHINTKFIGIDFNPVMTDYAASQSTGYPDVSFKTMDVFDPALMDEKADIAMNALFCHHFDEEQLAKLIRTMYTLSSTAVIINDLDRHWLAYHSIKWLTWLFSRTYLVKNDAALSVAKALRRHEWEAVLASAGIRDYSLRWMWAWRWQIIIPRSETNDGN